MEKILLTEYSFTGLSGTTYHPCYENGKWSFKPIKGVGVAGMDLTLDEIIRLCKIPGVEATFLKLKFRE